MNSLSMIDFLETARQYLQKSKDNSIPTKISYAVHSKLCQINDLSFC